jgi:glycosyltransferase involved in cell wall biosynthesis
MNKPSLLFINGAQFGYSSGHYFYCKYLTDSFRIYYICFDRGLSTLSLDGTNVIYVSFLGGKFSRSLRFLKECIKLSFIVRPDILFVTYFNVCFLSALFCRSKKRVLDIRTGNLRKNKFLRGIGNSGILLQSLFFDRVIILSDNLRKKLYIPVKKCKIVPLGSEIHFAGDHIFDNLNLLYVGALDDRHIDETIEGLYMFLKYYKEDFIELHYTIIGFGTENEILKITNCISECKLSEIVKFVGRKTNEELIPYFENSNVGIVYVPKTPWYDCQPVTKLFEYMLSGMPVIATGTYENKLIVNEVNGVIINDSAEDFYNGLTDIYNRRNAYNSSKIRRYVESYSWVNIVNTNLKPFLFKLLQ